MDCEHPAHTEEIKAKTVLPTSAEEVQSISTHQLCVLTASSLGMGTVQPVTAVPHHQSTSPYSAGDLQEKTTYQGPKYCKGLLTSWPWTFQNTEVRQTSLLLQDQNRETEKELLSSSIPYPEHTQWLYKQQLHFFSHLHMDCTHTALYTSFCYLWQIFLDLSFFTLAQKKLNTKRNFTTCFT